MVLGKQAACLRTVGDRHPDPRIAALELELKELGNGIGMGAMGFLGSSMVVDCHVEVGYTYTGGMPMSVHTFCLSSRRATARADTGVRSRCARIRDGLPLTCGGTRWNGQAKRRARGSRSDDPGGARRCAGPGWFTPHMQRGAVKWADEARSSRKSI